MSRTVNSVKNMISAYIGQIIVLILNFVVRSVMIRTLGEEYLGINGLFTNILSVLSLAELGVGTAILFKLYKPIEEKNKDRIQILLKLYKQIYIVIGWIIAGIGLVLIPFLRLIIKDYDNVAAMGINIGLIFLLYVFNSASSYWFFAYKQTIVKAHQKTYKLTVWGNWLSVCSGVAQIIVLLLFKNFVLYTGVMIAFNILVNFVYAKIAERMFPYIKEKNEGKISKKETVELFKDCGALLLYRINTAVVSASDNIAISVLKGISDVGIYSNYRVIIVSLKGLYAKFFDSIEASIGSVHATGNLQWKQNIYRVINFITVWIFAVGATCIAVLCDDFICVWIGEQFVVDGFWYNENVYVPAIRYLLAAEIFLSGYESFLARFRSAFGLFRQLKFRPVISMVSNLIVTIALVPFIGIAGAVIGTIVSLLINYTIDPIIIHKLELKSSLKRYFFKNAIYMLVAGLAMWASKKICALMTIQNTWIALIFDGIICVMVTSLFFLCIFFRSYEFKASVGTVRNMVKKKK